MSLLTHLTDLSRRLALHAACRGFPRHRRRPAVTKDLPPAKPNKRHRPIESSMTRMRKLIAPMKQDYHRVDLIPGNLGFGHILAKDTMVRICAIGMATKCISFVEEI